MLVGILGNSHDTSWAWIPGSGDGRILGIGKLQWDTGWMKNDESDEALVEIPGLGEGRIWSPNNELEHVVAWMRGN